MKVLRDLGGPILTWTRAGSCSSLRVRNAHLQYRAGMTADQHTELIDFLGKKFGKIDDQFAAIDRRFESIEGRFEAIDGRFDAVDHRFDALDHRLDRFEASVNLRFDRLHNKLDRLHMDHELRLVALEANRSDSRADT